MESTFLNQSHSTRLLEKFLVNFLVVVHTNFANWLGLHTFKKNMSPDSPRPSNPPTVPPPVCKRPRNTFGKRPRNTFGKCLDFEIVNLRGSGEEDSTSVEVKSPKTTRGSEKVGLQEENEFSQDTVKMPVEEQVTIMGRQLDKIEKLLFERNPLTGKLSPEEVTSREGWRRLANIHVKEIHRPAVGYHQ